MDHYVPEYIASAVETAKCDPKRDLVPWAWFSLGWFGTTLRTWRAFSASNRSFGANELHRAVPAALGAIEAALASLGRRIPVAVSGEVCRLTTRLREDHEDLARLRQGLPLHYDGRFESGAEAADEVIHQVCGIEPADECERPWFHFGFNLGAWMHNHLFTSMSLLEELDDLLNTCRELPQKVAVTLPKVMTDLRALTQPVAGVSERTLTDLACQVKRLCQPGWDLRFGEAATPAAEMTDSAAVPEHPFDRFLRNRSPGTPAGLSDTFHPAWLGAAVFSLVARLETELLTRTKRPVWVRTPTGGILKYDGVMVRRITGVKKSEDLISVLDEFEECGWPERIDSPLSEDSKIFHSKLYQLRKLLRHITFTADGTGNGICWSLRAQPD